MMEDNLPPITIKSEMGPARGIWQGPGQPDGTVRDCVNIDISNGRWTSRPVLASMFNESVQNERTLFVSEYVRDKRYATSSYYDAFITAGLSADYLGRLGVAYYTWINYNNRIVPQNNANALVDSNISLSSVMHLWKRSGDDGLKYGPALVICNKNIPTTIYHQFDCMTDGYSKFEVLDSIDGGFSDISYRATPPRGDYCAVYKERLFIANCDDAENRIWFTAPDSGGAFVCNVWPNSYNLDVGKSPITGLAVWKDYLLVFKSNSIYALSGDGAGGAWQTTLIDDKHGAMPGRSVVSCGDEIYFMSQTGIYKFNGRVECISHPALQDTWKDVTTSCTDDNAPFAVYDKQRDNVMFFVETKGSGCDSILVYNRKYKGWTRWGRLIAKDFYDDVAHIYSCAYYSNIFNRVIAGVNTYNFDGNQYTNFCTFVDRGDVDSMQHTLTKRVPWLIRTHNYFVDEPIEKQFRYLSVTSLASNSIGLYPYILPLVDGSNELDSIVRHSVSSSGEIHYSIINDEVDNKTHSVTRTPEFPTNSDLSVYYIPMATLVHYGRASVSVPAKTITWTTKFDSTGANGELAAVYYYTGEGDRVLYTLPYSYESPHRVSIDDNEVLELTGPEQKRLTVQLNETGRSISFIIHSFVPDSYYSYYSDITGWELSFRRLRTLRQ